MPDSIRRSAHQQMTPGEARVIDPILSEVAIGYTNADRVGRVLFPQVIIPQRGGRVIKFDKAAFRLYSARRAPGGKTKRVQYGFTGDPVYLLQDSLEGMVPYELQEEAMAVPGIDLGAMAVNNVMNSLTLGEEYEQAQLALDANQYDAQHKDALTGDAQWTSDSCNIALQMDTYKEAIRATIGVYPNTLMLSALAYAAAKRNYYVRDQFKYTSAASVTPDMLKGYFDLETIAVGKSVSVAENLPEDEDPSDIWGNNAVLAYVPPAGERALGRPAYGYTYTLAGYPWAETPYEDRAEKSWIYPVTHERRPYLVGISAGFLIQNPHGTF